jgi:hypothetical protein
LQRAGSSSTPRFVIPKSGGIYASSECIDRPARRAEAELLRQFGHQEDFAAWATETVRKSLFQCKTSRARESPQRQQGIRKPKTPLLALRA